MTLQMMPDELANGAMCLDGTCAIHPSHTALIPTDRTQA
jgi:hypothetical protein